jgi:hypothetical protein
LSEERPRAGAAVRVKGSRLARLVTALAWAIAGVVAVVLVASSSGERRPATGAAALVPSDALAYFHLSTDPSRPAVKRALRLAGRFPNYSLLNAAVTSRVGALAGGSGTVDFGRDVRPWLGREAAFALLNTPGSAAGTLLVLDVRNRARAQEFLAAGRASPDGTYRGAALLRYPTGTELAFIRHYLAVGQRSSVLAAIDAASSRSRSLMGSGAYTSAAAGEPAGRVLDIYISLAGVRRVLELRHGLLGALGLLLDQPAFTGATVSVSADKGSARVLLHSALDPNLAGLNKSSRAGFTPTLQGALPARSMVLDVGGLDRAAPRLLSAAAAAGVAPRVGPLLQRLGNALGAEGADVHSAASIFHGETAVAIVPGSGTHGAGSPSLVIVTRTSKESAVRTQLASLEAPLAQLFPPPAQGPGGAPEFNDVQVAGKTAHQLVLAPGLQIAYTVARGLVVIATSHDGLASVLSHRRSLASDPGWTSTLGQPDKNVTSLVFLDLSQLLSLGEQTGLLPRTRLGRLRPDLEKVRAIGLDSTRGKADTTAELYLKIS